MSERSRPAAYAWEKVLIRLEHERDEHGPANALRLACFLLRHHATDAEITDTMVDSAAEFFGRLADQDPKGAARIVAAIEDGDDAR